MFDTCTPNPVTLVSVVLARSRSERVRPTSAVSSKALRRDRRFPAALLVDGVDLHFSAPFGLRLQTRPALFKVAAVLIGQRVGDR